LTQVVLLSLFLLRLTICSSIKWENKSYPIRLTVFQDKISAKSRLIVTNCHKKLNQLGSSSLVQYLSYLHLFSWIKTMMFVRLVSTRMTLAVKITILHRCSLSESHYSRVCTSSMTSKINRFSPD
jgi:hypothetical protein